MWDHVDKIGKRISRGTGEFAQSVSSNNALDGVPLFSQGKSLIQVLSGDQEGAKTTQHHFTQRLVGVSQIRSTVERLRGDEAAAQATQAQFNGSLHRAENNLRAAGEFAEKGVSAASQRLQRLKESEAIADVARTTNRLAHQSSMAVGWAVTKFSENELIQKFRDLVGMQPGTQPGERRSQERRSREQGSEQMRVVNDDRPVDNLDECTLLTEVAPSHKGATCPCCLENLQEGELIRVLPCFHALHQQCAGPWLSTNPICPVCRCGIRASLERHRC